MQIIVKTINNSLKKKKKTDMFCLTFLSNGNEVRLVDGNDDDELLDIIGERIAD